MDNSFLDALLSLERTKVFKLAEQYSMEMGKNGFVDGIMVSAMQSIGQRWDEGTVSLAQIYLCSKIYEELINKIYPENECVYRKTPKIAIATLDDYHVMGKKIVLSTLRMAGFEVHDFGHGIAADALVDRVIKEGIRILLISVLMYPSATNVKKVTGELRARNWQGRVLVGGAPFLFDAELWKWVGADGMGRNAADNIEVIEKWVQEV